MIITGKILKSQDDKVLIGAHIPSYLLEKRDISTVEVVLTDGRTINADQRKKVYATLRDISLYTGHDPEELKALFKVDYIAKTGAEWFSLSNVDMTTANEFLQHIIDFCLEWEIPTQDSYLDRAPDVSRYLYKCLMTKTCVLCGKKAITHLVRPNEAVALCRKHAHEATTNKDFMDLHHIWPIKLDKFTK